MRPANVLFIDGLPSPLKSEDLRQMFQTFGTVLKAQVIMDYRGLSMGCGYVMMESEAEATEALDALSGPGTVLRVCRPPLPVAQAS